MNATAKKSKSTTRAQNITPSDIPANILFTNDDPHKQKLSKFWVVEMIVQDRRDHKGDRRPLDLPWRGLNKEGMQILMAESDETLRVGRRSRCFL